MQDSVPNSEPSLLRHQHTHAGSLLFVRTVACELTLLPFSAAQEQLRVKDEALVAAQEQLRMKDEALAAAQEQLRMKDEALAAAQRMKDEALVTAQELLFVKDEALTAAQEQLRIKDEALAAAQRMKHEAMAAAQEQLRMKDEVLAAAGVAGKPGRSWWGGRTLCALAAVTHLTVAVIMTAIAMRACTRAAPVIMAVPFDPSDPASLARSQATDTVKVGKAQRLVRT
jgi:hypothetical protein